MRLRKARVQKYRSIRDTGLFDVEEKKTILVGPNEAGKTAVLQALQQINPPTGIRPFAALRDYPRSEYNAITRKVVLPKDVTVVEGHFTLETDDLAAVHHTFHGCTYVVGRNLDNSFWHRLDNGPVTPTYGALKADLDQLCTQLDPRAPEPAVAATPRPSASLAAVTSDWVASDEISGPRSAALLAWLRANTSLLDKANTTEVDRHARLLAAAGQADQENFVLAELRKRLPVFVLFSNYFRVRPVLHLEQMAQRIESNSLDDKYDYGNFCLLKLLGFSARELSVLGKAVDPPGGNLDAFQKYRDQLDERAYQLNAASVELTKAIREVWVPDHSRDEADSLRIVADAQYLKVVVQDALGVDIELDQRSEGFQWLVSFFVVFFAETGAKHKNAILLLDEPGLSLHGLKQREFRTTISRLGESNQTLYTTHSPFLVGPDELDLVRVVEMTDRDVGTKVHTHITAQDPAALLPLQEALGYDLAQSLFGQQRNLVLEGLTDYWYLEAASQLLRDASLAALDSRIAPVFAAGAGKVVYYATILHAQKLKVAALLDSDAAGEQAAKQEVLVHTLGNRGILRTKDAYDGPVKAPEIEDMLRDTLVNIAKTELGWDVAILATAQPDRSIVSIFAEQVPDFSKYKLAKSFLRWARNQDAASLTADERRWWTTLFARINVALA